MEQPLVSIICITYNHEKYIIDALEGFLMQKDISPMEIIVHDDASTDGTTKIVEDFASKHPNLIKLITQRENQYSKGLKPIPLAIKHAKGKYIALCDGDDYWTDQYKLKKQVDFLENNPDYVITYHNAVIVDEEGNLLSDSKLEEHLKRDFSKDDLISGKMVLTLSMCFRNTIKDFPEEIHKVVNVDKFLTSLLGHYGKGKYMPEITEAVYRKHNNSIWSNLSKLQQIFINGNTRAWLSRYYRRINLPQWEDHFKKETIEHFKRVLKLSVSYNTTECEEVKRIFTDYRDIIDDEVDKTLRSIIAHHETKYNHELKNENKTEIHISPKVKDPISTGSKEEVITDTNKILKFGSLRALEKDELQINWVLTRKCNYSCSYCGSHNNKFPTSSTTDVKKVIEAIKRLSRDKIRITITGGEPTIDPNLNYILSSLLDKDNKTIHISVITNLSRSHNYFENFVEQFGERNNHISFVASYHIENANESNFIRNLEILSSGGFRVFAWILAHPLFMDEVKRIYNRIKDLNLKNTRVVPKAIRDEFGRSAFPDNRYKIEDLKWLNQFADDGEILFMDTYDQNLGRVTRKFYNLNEAITLKINKFKGMLCNAGINMISIDENGFVSPAVCLRSSSKNFNIFEDENALEKVKGPIVCPFDACKCLADLPLLKYTNDYEAKGINRSNASREEPYKHPLINALQTKGWEYKKDLYLEHFDYVLKLKETSSPSISVIVISWRLHEDTVKNFQILNKQRNQNFELIFVDNGGKEREFELLKPYVDIYIRLKNNTGAYLARNIGSVFASAPILLFLEDDGIPESNLIKSHLDIHKKYDVIAVRGVYKPKTSNVLNRYAAHYFLGDKPFPYPSNLEGNSSYRADIFYKVGGWNDEIFFGHGGKELAIRLLREENDPRKQIYSPEPIIYHDFATDNAHLAKKIRKQQESLSDLKKKYPEWDTIISTWKKFFARHDQLIPKIILDERQEKSINYHSHLLKALSYYEHGETDMAKNHLLSLITELKEIAR